MAIKKQKSSENFSNLANPSFSRDLTDSIEGGKPINPISASLERGFELQEPSENNQTSDGKTTRGRNR